MEFIGRENCKGELQMKRVLKRIGILAVTLSLLQGSMPIMAAEDDIYEIPNTKIEIMSSDEEQVSAMTATLTACTFGISARSEGVGLTLGTTASASASEIGVKDIVIQEKTLFGWRDINVDKQYVNNSDVFSGGVILYSAEKGKTYRAHGTHYAIINGKEYTLYAESAELVYN